MSTSSCNDWRATRSMSKSLLANNAEKVARVSGFAKCGLKPQLSRVPNMAEERRPPNVDCRGYKMVHLGNSKPTSEESRLLNDSRSAKEADEMFGGRPKGIVMTGSQSSCSEEFSYYSESPGSAQTQALEDEESRNYLKYPPARLLKQSIQMMTLPVVSEEVDHFVSISDTDHVSFDKPSKVSLGGSIPRQDLLGSQNKREEFQEQPSIACLRDMYSKLRLGEARHRNTCQQISTSSAIPLLLNPNKRRVSIENSTEISETERKRLAFGDKGPVNPENLFDGHCQQDSVVSDSIPHIFDETLSIPQCGQNPEAFREVVSSKSKAISSITYLNKFSTTKIGLPLPTSALAPSSASEVKKRIIHKSSESSLKIRKESASSPFAVKRSLLLQNLNLASFDVRGNTSDQNQRHNNKSNPSSSDGLDHEAIAENIARSIERERGHLCHVKPEHITPRLPTNPALGNTDEHVNCAASQLDGASNEDAPDTTVENKGDLIKSETLPKEGKPPTESNGDLIKSETLPKKGKPPKTLIKDRHYTLYETLSIQEDVCHEFKGHRSISVYDIPKPCMDSEGEASRNSVSVSMCGFLNTGLGGTIYLGVTDNATVIGLRLTLYQRDHVVTSVRHTLSRFTPRVPARCCWLNFVPVVKKTKKTSRRGGGRKGGTVAGGKDDEARRLEGGVDTAEEDGKTGQERRNENRTDGEVFDGDRRRQPHTVSQSRHCWCDADAAARVHIGDDIPLYVVEIHIRPWEPHAVLPWLKLSSLNHSDGRASHCPAETFSTTSRHVTNKLPATMKERKEGAAGSGSDCKDEPPGNLQTFRGNDERIQTPLNDHKEDLPNVMSSNESRLEPGSKESYSSNDVTSSLSYACPVGIKGDSKLTLYQRCRRLLTGHAARQSGRSSDEFEDCDKLSKDVVHGSKSPSTDASGSGDADESQCKMKATYRDSEGKKLEEIAMRVKCDAVPRMDLFDRSQLPYLAPFPPVYLDEIGICYYRQSSGHLRLSLSAVRALLQHRVQEHYALMAQALSHRAKQLRKQLSAFSDDQEP